MRTRVYCRLYYERRIFEYLTLDQVVQEVGPAAWALVIAADSAPETASYALGVVSAMWLLRTLTLKSVFGSREDPDTCGRKWAAVHRLLHPDLSKGVNREALDFLENAAYSERKCVDKPSDYGFRPEEFVAPILELVRRDGNWSRPIFALACFVEGVLPLQRLAHDLGSGPLLAALLQHTDYMCVWGAVEALGAVYNHATLADTLKTAPDIFTTVLPDLITIWGSPLRIGESFMAAAILKTFTALCRHSTDLQTLCGGDVLAALLKMLVAGFAYEDLVTEFVVALSPVQKNVDRILAYPGFADAVVKLSQGPVKQAAALIVAVGGSPGACIVQKQWTAQGVVGALVQEMCKSDRAMPVRALKAMLQCETCKAQVVRAVLAHDGVRVLANIVADGDSDRSRRETAVACFDHLKWVLDPEDLHAVVYNR